MSRPSEVRLRIRRLASAELTAEEVARIREILWAAFTDDGEGFEEEDWDHALGGVHIVLDVDDVILAHASVVRRDIRFGGRPLRTGYVEAVAVAPPAQGIGLGTAVMREVGAVIEDGGFGIGMLGTGSHGFYERLGWRTWPGPSSVRTSEGEEPTPDDDGYLMVLRTSRTPVLDPAASISCEWREGDVW